MASRREATTELALMHFPVHERQQPRGTSVFVAVLPVEDESDPQHPKCQCREATTEHRHEHAEGDGVGCHSSTVIPSSRPPPHGSALLGWHSCRVSAKLSWVPHPMPLVHISEPFDHPDWLFELKLMASAPSRTSRHHCKLISRRGHVFKHWPMLEVEVAHAVRCDSAIVDGKCVASMTMADPTSTSYCSAPTGRSSARLIC